MKRHTIEAGVYVGPTDLILELMFGPFQHDAHVAARRRRLWLDRERARDDAAYARVAAEADRMNAEYRARHQQHGAS